MEFALLKKSYNYIWKTQYQETLCWLIHDTFLNSLYLVQSILNKNCNQDSYSYTPWKKKNYL